MIPKQLQNKDFRFIRVSNPNASHPAAGKKPIGANWQKDNNDSYDSERLNTWFKQKNGNYGVVSGFGGLIIVDIDNERGERIAESTLPLTFKVKTKNGFHRYYLCPELKHKIVLTKDKVHYGEIQAGGAMVVGPNSTHKTGVKYKVEYDIEIAKINLRDLKDLLLYLKDEKSKTEPVEKVNNNDSLLFDSSRLNRLYKIKMSQLIKVNGNIKHPFHESEGEANFSVSTSLAHCWRHGVSINPIQFLAMKTGYFTCEQVGTKHNTGECETDYARLTLYAYIQAVIDKLIPKSTRIPRAVVYYLAKKKYGIEKDKFTPGDPIPPLLNHCINNIMNSYINCIKEGIKIDI